MALNFLYTFEIKLLYSLSPSQLFLLHDYPTNQPQKMASSDWIMVIADEMA